MELYFYWSLQLFAILVSNSLLIWQLLFAFNYGILSYYTDPHEKVSITLMI